MNTTKILGEAVGIQSQGIVDRTETQTKVGLTSAIIIGQFKRGRVDRPMTIHNGNIRGQLGHEPNNPYYNAVQDCLDTGVPSVQVLRVGGIDDENPPTISCEGATSTAILNTVWQYRAQVWDVILNGQLFRDLVTTDNGMLSASLAFIFNTGALGAACQSLALEVYWDSSSDVNFYNQGENPVRIILVPKNEAAREDVDVGLHNQNPTVYKDEVTNEISFCLAPYVPPIEEPVWEITILRETEDNNPVVYLEPHPNVPMATATVTVYISVIPIDVNNLQNYYHRDVPLSWDGRRTTRIFGNTGVDQYVLYTVEFDNQQAISNVLVIRNGLEFIATEHMPAESCVIDDHYVDFTILQNPSLPTFVVPPQSVGYLIPSGVSALVSLDNQLQMIANFTGGTGTSHFYIEYVIEQVPVDPLHGIHQLQAGVAPSKLNESGTNTSTKYNNVRHSYYQRTPQGSPYLWTETSYPDANLVAFAEGDTIGFGMYFNEASQTWVCQLFKNHVFVKDLISYTWLQMNNSHIYLFGLCFGEYIQIGETYKVRLGDQTFKPYGNNTTYL